MALSKSGQQENSSLEGFEFDDEESTTFFGVKAKPNEQELTLKEIKGQTINQGSRPETTDFDELPKSKSKAGRQDALTDEEEDEEVTFFEDKPKGKGKAQAQEKEDEDEEEDEEEVKVKPKKAKKDEEEDDEDSDEGTKSVKKKVSKKEESEEEEDEEDTETKARARKKAKDEEEENEEEDEKAKEENFYTTLAEELKESGIFSLVEIPKNKKITEEEFFELHDKEIEARVDETFQGFFEELNKDEDAIAFLKFKKNGGNTSDFFSTYSKGIGISKFDENNDEHVKKILTHYVTHYEKVDTEEDLQDRLQYFKDQGKEKANAAKFYAKIKEEEKAAKEALEEKAEKAKARIEAENQAFDEELKKVSEKTEAVGIFPFEKKEMKSLVDYITKPTVKVGKNKFIPAFNADLGAVLNASTQEGKKQLLLLGKLLKNSFNIKDELLTEAETKVVKRAKSKLMDAKNSRRPSSSSTGSSGAKTMADYFE